MITIHNSGAMGREYSKLLVANMGDMIEVYLEGESTVELTRLQAAKLAHALRAWSDEVMEAQPPSDFEGSL